MPTKHIPLDRSLIGVGVTLLDELQTPKTISGLWESVRDNSSIGTFDRFSLGLTFLFTIGAVFLESGMIAGNFSNDS